MGVKAPQVESYYQLFHNDATFHVDLQQYGGSYLAVSASSWYQRGVPPTLRVVGSAKHKITCGETVFERAIKVYVDVAGQRLHLSTDLALFQRDVTQWVVESGALTPDSLKFLRQRAGLKSSELARLLGTDPSRVTDWEKGRHAFTAATWNTVCALAVEAMSIPTQQTTKRRLEAAATRDGATPLPPVVRL